MCVLRGRARALVGRTRRPGDTAGFQRTASTLAGELVEESFGPEMLEALGYYYELKGMQYLGATKVRAKRGARLPGRYGSDTLEWRALCCRGWRGQLLGLAGMYHGARERVHAVKEAVGVVSYGVDLQMAAQQRQMHEEKGTLNEETLRKLEQEMAAKSRPGVTHAGTLVGAHLITVRRARRGVRWAAHTRASDRRSVGREQNGDGVGSPGCVRECAPRIECVQGRPACPCGGAQGARPHVSRRGARQALGDSAAARRRQRGAVVAVIGDSFRFLVSFPVCVSSFLFFFKCHVRRACTVVHVARPCTTTRFTPRPLPSRQSRLPVVPRTGARPPCSR